MSQSPNSSRTEAVKHLWMWMRKQSKRLRSLLKIIRMWKNFFSSCGTWHFCGMGGESGNIMVVSSWKLQTVWRRSSVRVAGFITILLHAGGLLSPCSLLSYLSEVPLLFFWFLMIKTCSMSSLLGMRRGKE